MLFKLKILDISGLLYSAIQAIYENLNSYVQINDIFTNKFTTTAGVRQGDPLSSTLFSICINDVPLSVRANILIQMLNQLM